MNTSTEVPTNGYKSTDKQRADARERYYRRKEREIGDPLGRKVRSLALGPAYDKKKPANVLPLLRKLTIEIPADLQSVFGKEFNMNNDLSTWYFMHSKPIETLSEITQKQYKQNYKRLEKLSANVFDRIRFILSQPLATKAQMIKSYLAHIADDVRILHNKPVGIQSTAKYQQLVEEMFLFAHLSKNTKKLVKETQLSQIATPERIENTVDWEEWVKKAGKYAKGFYDKTNSTMEDLTNMALLALYSMMPPIRLDYDNVVVVSKRPKSMTENTLVLAGPKTSTFYWYKFKNADAFKREGTLPVVLPITNSVLLKYLKKYYRLKQSLYPDDNKLFNLPHFSEKLTAVAELATGKRFTNRLMRSSYIQSFYSAVEGGAIDLTAVQEMMRAIHQTNIEVSLSYIKKLATGETELD